MSSPEPLDQPAEPDENEQQSWDDFWAEQMRAEQAEREGPPTKTIRGVKVAVPHDLPLMFEIRADQLRGSSDQAAFEQLIGDLFGAQVLDAWIANGMGEREFRTVLAWGLANGRGDTMTFRQAYDLVRARELGKAARKTETSDQENAESESSGGRSKPTSAANTSSRRKRSGS
ncbi:hypothetical protein ITP53_39380 [Nonomuraea sp. K274]|uniref:Tail assembly chaperone n=1 Tax=Nonomuraea cypriaca TaxID=1187855 RepID=A0A931AF02_9ACTN|nr:hypothetical protein [Nonomuraea cypriaca]MBF8191656.1 hypothetical protein [Nonomuraea cypriaca]